MNALGDADVLLLGIDGGGSRCRARLCSLSGAKLGEGTGGPSNIRLGVDQSFASVLQATTRCISQAGLSPRDFASLSQSGFRHRCAGGLRWRTWGT